MIEITSYARRYRTMRDEGPRECFPGSECSGHRCLNPALNSAGFEGYEPAGSHRRGCSSNVFLRVRRSVPANAENATHTTRELTKSPPSQPGGFFLAVRNTLISTNDGRRGAAGSVLDLPPIPHAQRAPKHNADKNPLP